MEGVRFLRLWFCSCVTVLVVVMVLVCGCSCGAGIALVPVPLIALPVMFSALVMKQDVVLFSCSNALSRVPMTRYRSAGNSKGRPYQGPLCIAPRKDNFVFRPCALNASSYGCRFDWTPHLTAPYSALQVFYNVRHGADTL